MLAGSLARTLQAWKAIAPFPKETFPFCRQPASIQPETMMEKSG
jgi:hypothetical protein